MPLAMAGDKYVTDKQIEVDVEDNETVRKSDNN